MSGAANKLSVEFLRECFDYRDGVLYWKERPVRHFQRPADHATFVKKCAGKPAGRKDADGYITIGLRVDGRAISMSRHRVVWALHHGKWPDLHIDHINRRPGDDWIANLREVTPAENAKNSAKNRVHPYVSGYHHGRFVAWTNIGGQKAVHLGIFDTEEEAVAHRDQVNNELEKLALSLAKRTPRPATHRKREVHETFSRETPMPSDKTPGG